MNIPLFDCRVDAAGIASVSTVLSTGQLASGAHISALERELSHRVAGRPVVLLNDMTHALELALRLAGLGEGDEVLTLSYNCLSSNSALHRAGVSAVWVDIDPATASMNVEDARSRITPATRAVTVYHVAGYPADTAALRKMCDQNGLVLIEDANNALSATLPGGAPAGSVGDYAVFSFYANRQVNGIEGAALVCPNEATAARARKLRRFGIDQSRFRDSLGEIDPTADVEDVGLSASMTNVNAALARHSLTLLDERQAVLNGNAEWMIAALAAVPGIQPVRAIEDARPAFWSLLLLSDRRDRVLEHLKSHGVSCSKLHQPNHSYSGFGIGAPFLPGTKRLMESVIAIPCGWWVSPHERQAIVDMIIKVQTTGAAIA